MRIDCSGVVEIAANAFDVIARSNAKPEPNNAGLQGQPGEPWLCTHPRDGIHAI